MTEAAETSLNEHGVHVIPSACSDDLCGSCLEEIESAILDFNSFPLSMAKRNRGSTHRYFFPIKEPNTPPVCRQSYSLPLSPKLRSLLSTILNGPIGTIISSTLGPSCDLTGLLYTVSEKGSAKQDMHSDGDYLSEGPRTITCFIAVQDILDEIMGPTCFIPDTHLPRCFPNKTWLPPTFENGLIDKDQKWFPLKAGDAVLMDSTTWHCGGSNMSEKKRVLLSFSCTQANKNNFCSWGLDKGGGAEEKVKL